jgi:hypothetical protein
MLLSVVLTVHASALETMTVYQTQTLKVAELHRVNKNKVDLVIVELDKVERLEAELTRQANFAPDAKESDGEKAIRGQFNQLTINALGRAWRDVVHAQLQGVKIARLPAVSFRGKVYHEVHDIRSILNQK